MTEDQIYDKEFGRPSEFIESKYTRKADHEILLNYHRRSQWLMHSIAGASTDFISVPSDILPELEQQSRETVLSKGLDDVIHLDAIDDQRRMDRLPSATNFSKTSIGLDSLAEALACSFGTVPNRESRRPYPSAGCLYPVEPVFWASSKTINGLPETGFWHYLSTTHALEKLAGCDTKSFVSLLGREDLPYGEPLGAIIYFLNVRRSIVKYRQRGYRHALIEVGAMSHQFDLVANQLQWATRLFSAFDDYRLCLSANFNPRMFLPISLQFFGPSDE